MREMLQMDGRRMGITKHRAAVGTGDEVFHK